jgi:hypothetical protein
MAGCVANAVPQDESNAKLTKFSIENQTDIILTLSNPIQVNSQITAKLLAPMDPIWKDNKQTSDPLFSEFKYEILLRDILPEENPQNQFEEPMIFEGTSGLIRSVQGTPAADGTSSMIYVGIGKESARIKIKDMGTNKILISIYR